MLMHVLFCILRHSLDVQVHFANPKLEAHFATRHMYCECQAQVQNVFIHSFKFYLWFDLADGVGEVCSRNRTWLRARHELEEPRRRHVGTS
jgi:hypothetical protein